MERREDAITLSFINRNIPWLIVGILVIAGGLASLFYGLPWAKQTDVDKLTAVVAADHDSMHSISSTQAVATEQQKMTATLLTQLQQDMKDLRGETEANSIHIEGLEADEKAHDAHDALRSGR